jgi:nucleoid DNA-binding protein
MDKRQLIEAAAQRTVLSRQEVRIALEALVDVIAEALAGGDEVILKDFGRFGVHEVPPYTIRHVQTRWPQLVSGVRLPVFKSSAALRRRLREERDDAT